MSPARSVVAMVVTWLMVAATSARSEHAITGHCAVSTLEEMLVDSIQAALTYLACVQVRPP